MPFSVPESFVFLSVLFWSTAIPEACAPTHLTRKCTRELMTRQLLFVFIGCYLFIYMLKNISSSTWSLKKMIQINVGLIVAILFIFLPTYLQSKVPSFKVSKKLSISPETSMFSLVIILIHSKHSCARASLYLALTCSTKFPNIISYNIITGVYHRLKSIHLQYKKLCVTIGFPIYFAHLNYMSFNIIFKCSPFLIFLGMNI